MSEQDLEQIGVRYRVVRQLGRGGMGWVYEAVDDTTGRRVAVKVILTEMAKNPTLMGRFEREARAAADIDAAHVVRVLDAGADPRSGLPYIVMEYLDGEDFQQLLKRLGPVPAELALRVAAEACIALKHAHDKRIVHRDIKPGNFFLAKLGDGLRIVKLLDFGVAKIKPDPSQDISGQTAGFTRTGSMIGSPLYMAPEQVRGYKDIDFRADLWSLGVVLYQALSGRTPHADADDFGDLLIRICTEPPEPLQQAAPWVAPEVAAIVHKALRINRDERFRSAADMLSAMMPLISGDAEIDESMLRSLAPVERSQVAPKLTQSLADAAPPRKGTTTGSGGSSAAQLSTLSASAVESASAPTLPAFPVPPSTQPTRRSPAPLVAAVAGAALVVAGVAVYATMRPSAPPAPPSEAQPLLAGTGQAALTRRVMLVVIPGSAKVEVDGVAVSVKDGLVEVQGPLGSVHRVHLSEGGADLVGDVVVTEGGAMPPKLELGKPAATSATPPLPRPLGTPREAPRGGGAKQPPALSAEPTQAPPPLRTSR